VRHLRYDMMTASLDCEESRHAQVVMRELGVTYRLAVPQSMADQWWFFDCKNIPEPLPKFLSDSTDDFTPLTKLIGWGLSPENVAMLEQAATPSGDA
jgi:hypothetical protein